MTGTISTMYYTLQALARQLRIGKRLTANSNIARGRRAEGHLVLGALVTSGLTPGKNHQS